MTDWHGNILGEAVFVASWPVHSYMGSRMYQVEATINGTIYTGRSMGSGMLYRGKRKGPVAP